MYRSQRVETLCGNEPPCGSETYTGDRGVDLLECARAAQQPLRAAIVRDPFDVAAETYLLETISHRFKTPTSFIC